MPRGTQKIYGYVMCGNKSSFMTKVDGQTVWRASQEGLFSDKDEMLARAYDAYANAFDEFEFEPDDDDDEPRDAEGDALMDKGTFKEKYPQTVTIHSPWSHVNIEFFERELPLQGAEGKKEEAES